MMYSAATRTTVTTGRGLRCLAAFLLGCGLAGGGTALAQDSGTAAAPPPAGATENPKDEVGLRCEYGITLALKGDLDKAEGVFESLLSANPGDARVHTNLGNLCLLRGEVENALAFYDHALAADTTDAGIILNRAIALMLLGRNDGARTAAAAAIAKAGGPEKAAGLVGIELEEKADPKASQRVFLNEEEIKDLLLSALGVGEAQANTPAEGAAAPGEGGDEDVNRRMRIFSSGAPRASDGGQNQALLYWKQ
jgi:tetratricopeptide (TPR) repeat protein